MASPETSELGIGPLRVARPAARVGYGWLRRLVAATFPTIVVLGALELLIDVFAAPYVMLARPAVGGAPMHLSIFRNPQANNLQLQSVNPHDADDALGWRNKRGFHDALFRTDSNGLLSPHEVGFRRRDGRYRLMIVGDSSTAGLGLHRYAEVWPQVVAAARRRNVEVINAAVIGYSSEQAVRFLAGDGDRYEVDGLLVYLGNNDTAASSMSDAALLERIAQSPRGIQAAHAWALDHSGLYVLVATAAQWSNALMQHRDFQSEAGAVVTREARVPLARFRDNLTTMIDWARRRGAEVYVVTPPLPLAYPPYVNEYVFRERYQPGWSGDACLGDDKSLGAVIPAVVDVDHAAERWPQFDLIRTYDSDALGCLDAGADEQHRRFGALVEGGTPSAIAYDNLGYLEFRAGHYDRAAPLFATALARQSGSNAYYDGVAAIAAYNAGVTAERLRDHAAAAAYLRQAIDLEEGKVRSSYVDAIRGLAARDVHVVEAQERFFAREAVGTETLFTDQVHPNRAGQKLVAKMVLRALPARVVAK